MPRTKPRGVTLIEIMVVVAIIGVLSYLAASSMRRSRPLATLDSVAADLQGAIHLARQEALSRGVNVGVLVFPDFDSANLQAPDRVLARARVVVVADGPPTIPGNTALDPPKPNSFFYPPPAVVADRPFNFSDFDPRHVRPPNLGDVITTIDFPQGVVVGPPAGLGAALKFPYASIGTQVDCSFCGADGDHRGAIVYDARGRSRFLSLSGGEIVDTPGTSAGASISLYPTQLVETGAGGKHVPVATLVVTSPQGTVRTFRSLEELK